MHLLRVAAVLLCACNSAPPTDATAPAAAGATFELLIDGVLMDPPPAVLETRPLLHDFVDLPADRWEVVSVRGHGGGKMVLERPAEVHGDHEIRLFAGSDGSTSIGLFRRIDDLVPPGLRDKLTRPKLHTNRVERVEVLSTAPAPAVPVDRVVLSLVANGRTLDVLRRDFAELPSIRARRRLADDAELTNRAKKKLVTEGASLAGLAALATPLDQIVSVQVESEANRASFTREQLTAEQPPALVRINRRGDAVLELLDVDAGSESMRIRGITTVRITTK